MTLAFSNGEFLDSRTSAGFSFAVWWWAGVKNLWSGECYQFINIKYITFKVCSTKNKTTEKYTNFFCSFFSLNQTDNGLKTTPKILDDIFASLVQNRTITDLPRKPQGLTIKPTIMGFDTPHYWLCDNRLLCLQDPNNESNWNVFRECWKQGQVFEMCYFGHFQVISFALLRKRQVKTYCNDNQH